MFASVALITCFLVLQPRLAHSQNYPTVPEVDVSQFLPEDQTWDWSPDSRCRIYAHASTQLHNENHHLLVVDAGYGTFRTQLDGQIVQVSDLNPYTVAFDLSKDFDTPDLEVLWSYRKSANSSEKRSIVNFGSLWKSADHNTVWTQGGHFYHGNKYLNSSYFVPKSEIPDWELWEMNVQSQNYNAGWSNITDNILGSDMVNRTFAGTASSPSDSSEKFWLGGVFDSTTSSTSPPDTIQSTNQLLIFDETSKSIRREHVYSEEDVNGYWQGSLLHLPIGDGNRTGYLMSLMSLSNPVADSWIDPDGESQTEEVGTSVSLDSIPMYDLNERVWIHQKTTWYKDELPIARSRFCAVMFHDEKDGRWDLWVHGGQRVGVNQNEGVEEIYVLSMPSFIWTKLETTQAYTNLIRSHTCHAIGGQLVIVGGWPTGVEQVNATCDPEYIKVLDISEDTPSWSGQYKTESVYRTPKSIQNVVNGRSTPQDDFATTQLQKDFHTGSGSNNVGLIAGVTVGGLVVLLLVAYFGWRRYKNKARKRQAGEAQCPGSPRSEQPEVVRVQHGPAQVINTYHSGPESPNYLTRTTSELQGSTPAPAAARTKTPSVDISP